MVPPDLSEIAERRFRDDPHVKVVVERRAGERRRGEDRRQRDDDPPDSIDRRGLRDEQWRLGERRVAMVPVETPPPLPGEIARHADRISFLRPAGEEEIEPDADAARLRTQLAHARARLTRTESMAAEWRERCLEAERRSLELLRALVGAADDLRNLRRLSASWLLAVRRATNAIDRHRRAVESRRRAA
jgi:hypothetical protein